MSASCTTGTSRPMPSLGATARPMLIARLRWNFPSTHEVLTSGNLRSASAHARTSMSVIVTLSAPGTDSFSCCRRLTAWSTRASTVTVNSGTGAFDSVIPRAMVACMRDGSTTSTSAPAGRGAASGRLRSPVLVPAAASTSSLTMRPSGPLPFSVPMSTPSSAARRLARGEALTCWPSSAALVSGASVTVSGCSASCGSVGGGADLAAALGASATSAGGSGSFSFSFALAGAAFSLAGAAEASPMRAIGAPVFAGPPCSHRIDSTPPLSASRSKVALSDSTSAITSPAFTSSPVFFFHSTMVPSSIVSESFGMLTSGIGLLSDHGADELLDVLAGGDRCLFERQAVRHRHLRAAQAPHRRVQVVEAALRHAGRDLGRHTVGRPALLDHHAAACLADRVHDRLPVDRSYGAQVDDLSVHVLFLQLLGGFERQHCHPRHSD